jgi:hypothetical protein
VSPSNPSFIRLGLQAPEKIKDSAVREELELLVAAIQQWASKVLDIENIPLDDISIDASQVVSGILKRERGGTGIDTSGGTNGQLIIARTSLTPVLATLTAGSNIAITNGSGSIQLDVTGITGGHVHGLDRQVGDGSATTFDLVDVAEYLELVSVNGAVLDPLLVTLSSDGTQITLSSAPTAGQVIVASYVIASL